MERRILIGGESGRFKSTPTFYVGDILFFNDYKLFRTALYTIVTQFDFFFH